MKKIIRINDLNAKEIDVYVRLTGAQLRAAREADEGIFIAESPTVIDVALRSGCEPISLLTDERLLVGDAVKGIIDRLGDIPIYTANRDILTEITGFELTRGALCAMRRPKFLPVAELCKNAKRIAILENVCDATNLGAIIRSAAALGMDAVLLSPACCDPYCRRAVRVSMGTVFQVPTTRIEDTEQWPKKSIETLKSLGFKCAAMALKSDSVNITDENLLKEEKIALILGTEGTGLTAETIELCDYTVCIPMAHGVDSLNVGAAAAIAFFEVCK